MSQISVLTIYFHETNWTILNDFEQKNAKNFDGSFNMAIFGHYGSTAKIVSFEPESSEKSLDKKFTKKNSK